MGGDGDVDSLFRSSRPDYIETGRRRDSLSTFSTLFRSSRPDYIETGAYPQGGTGSLALFRSSRPDYIEMETPQTETRNGRGIVPVFQAGLH